MRKRRKLKAEINVVPYIDVMLVLLIIFMVTAPLLNLGVDVDLPKSRAHALQQKKDSLVVGIDKAGQYSLDIPDPSGKSNKRTVAYGDLLAQVSAFHEQNPDAAVYIAADGSLDYQKVMDLMSLLQQAGVPKVALMSQPGSGDAAGAGGR
ncbi:MAG: protein TolR [Proteobacteria bacterium]|nr:protein TolR [Pseudomonadota bacterium]